MSKITPYLWFDGQLQQAMDFYISIFPDARITSAQHGPQGPDGPIFTATFELAGQKFIGLNGGPQFKFTEAISFMIDCTGQEEVDYFWDRLTADGGEESMCSWCKDKFGLSWQVVPRQLMETVGGPDPEGRQRAVDAMLKMRKIIVADLERAYRG